jgi:hypothetical protein
LFLLLIQAEIIFGFKFKKAVGDVLSDLPRANPTEHRPQLPHQGMLPSNLTCPPPENDNGIWSCANCTISNRIENTSKTTGYPTLSAYQKHIVADHRGLTFDPTPTDLDDFKTKLISKKNKKKDLAEIAEANLSGNGVMFGNKEE